MEVRRRKIFDPIQEGLKLTHIVEKFRQKQVGEQEEVQQEWSRKYPMVGVAG